MSEKITFEVTDQKEEITFSFSEAARGPAGSDANVTNANVNAAIEDDPEATREALEIPIDNFSAITAPTINDDSSDGYSAGSKWYDTVGQEAYLCVDASVGAAVWILATLTADDLGSAAFTASTDYATAAQGALADSALQPGDLSAPPAIGDGTPNSGAFTTLSATGTATLPHIHGSLAGNLYIHVRNTTGGVLSRGTPIYIVGNVGDTDRVTVAAADNTNAAKMPAVGLLEESLNNNGDGNAIIVGELPAANTNSYSINQELYVGVGAITGTKPTTGEVQSVGAVARVNTNTGVIVVNMQGRRTRDGAFATAAQGALADSAVQPGDLATVATTGAYADLSGTPTLGNSAALNVGTTAGTVAAGDDARLSDARTPLSHTHGNISNDGKIGSTENLPIITTTSGVLTTGSFGTTANTFTQGNDSRLSDERVPTAAGLTTKFGTAKATPVDADKVAILDSAASDAPKHSTLTAIWTWIQSKFAGASSKTTPIDADSFNIVDSADSNAAKRVTGTNLKAYLKTYLDTLYVALTGNQTVAGNKTFSGSTTLTGGVAGNVAFDTSTLYVDATNDRVGVGVAAPVTPFQVVGARTIDGMPCTAVFSDPTTPTKRVNIGYNTALNCGQIQSVNSGVQFTNLILNPYGGSVGIGAEPIGKFSVSDDATYNTVSSWGFVVSSLANTFYRVGLGYDQTNDVGYLQSVLEGSAFKRIAINPNGGNVGINNAAPTVALDVTGSAKVSGTLTVGGTNTWNGSTIAGAQAFSSTTRPTSSGTGTPASNSLITRADADSRYWSPRMISGITLYLEANELLYQGTATPTDGSEVTSWKSAHRNGTSEISVVQAGGTLKPLFKTSVQNSLNGVLFDGSNDLLQSATGYNGFVSNTGRTMFVVCRPTVQVSTGSGTSYARPQLVANLSQFNGIAVSPSGSGNIFTAWDYDSSGALIQASTAEVATNTAVVITNRHQTGTSLIQVNKSTPVTATTLRECTNGSALQIGTSGGSAYYTGYIFETIIFGRALSNDEISAVQDFLISKWGI